MKEHSAMLCAFWLTTSLQLMRSIAIVFVRLFPRPSRHHSRLSQPIPMEQPGDPSLLVYDSCWDILFSRDEYRTTRQAIEETAYNGPTYTIDLDTLNDLAASGYAWCSFILSGVRQNAELRPPKKGQLAMEFSSFTFQETRLLLLEIAWRR